MNSLRLALPALLSSCLALAGPDGGSSAAEGRGAGVCVVNPKARYKVSFDRAELMKVIITVSDLTCKIVVLGAGTEKTPITISAPRSEEMSPERFFAAFVAAVEANGLKVAEKDGIVRITK